MVGNPKVIRSEREYRAALARIDELLEARTPAQIEELETWAILVEAWENETAPIGPPEPLEFLKFVMEQRGLTAADLGKVIGSRPRATEILNGSREMSKEMIRRIAAEWDLPAAVLLGPVSSRAA